MIEMNDMPEEYMQELIEKDGINTTVDTTVDE